MRFSTGLHANSHGGQRRPAGSLPEPYGPWRVPVSWWRTSSLRPPRCRGSAWSAARTREGGAGPGSARRSPSPRPPAPATCPWTRSGGTDRDRRTGRRQAATTCRRPSVAPLGAVPRQPGGRLVKAPRARLRPARTTASSERACMAALRRRCTCTPASRCGRPGRSAQALSPARVAAQSRAMAKAGRNQHRHGCPRTTGSAVLRSRESPGSGDAF